MKLDLVTDSILMGAIILTGAIGLYTFVIWLYHRDGGTCPTRILMRNAVIAFFAPLTSIWHRIVEWASAARRPKT